jgi:hypothetical protein
MYHTSDTHLFTPHCISPLHASYCYYKLPGGTELESEIPNPTQKKMRARSQGDAGRDPSDRAPEIRVGTCSTRL